MCSPRPSWSPGDDDGETPGDALPWLYAVAGNVVLNRLRAERRRGALQARIASEAPAARSDHVPDPKLGEALAQLKPIDREALLLTAWEDSRPTARRALPDAAAPPSTSRLHRRAAGSHRHWLRSRGNDERPDRPPAGGEPGHGRAGAATDRAAARPTADERTAAARAAARSRLLFVPALVVTVLLAIVVAPRCAARTSTWSPRRARRSAAGGIVHVIARDSASTPTERWSTARAGPRRSGRRGDRALPRPRRGLRGRVRRRRGDHARERQAQLHPARRRGPGAPPRTSTTPPA